MQKTKKKKTKMKRANKEINTERGDGVAGRDERCVRGKVEGGGKGEGGVVSPLSSCCVLRAVSDPSPLLPVHVFTAHGQKKKKENT